MRLDKLRGQDSGEKGDGRHTCCEGPKSDLLLLYPGASVEDGERGGGEGRPWHTTERMDAMRSCFENIDATRRPRHDIGLGAMNTWHHGATGLKDTPYIPSKKGMATSIAKLLNFHCHSPTRTYHSHPPFPLAEAAR